MPPSYRLVNFRLRPAKVVERRMIIDVIPRMSAFSNLAGFRYIGLGSPFFSDFTLVHRRYGLTHLVCIERESQDKDRFLFNRPFDCIEMKWGESSTILPSLDWRDIPTIMWMDYDDPICEEMLSDVGTIFGQIEPGSLVLFTIQAEGRAFELEDDEAEDELNRLDVLRDRIGDFVPYDASLRDMRGKAFQKLIRRIFDSEVNRILDQRNAAIPNQNAVKYKQLFNVLYSDNARMTTVGGVIYRADQEQRLADCEFSDFDFLRESEEPLEIKIPVLTYREQLRIASNLPTRAPTVPFIAPGDLSAYSSLYRYYPTFMETDL